MWRPFGDTLVTQRLTNVLTPRYGLTWACSCGAHNDTVMERATFSHVRITTPAQRTALPVALRTFALRRLDATSSAIFYSLFTASLCYSGSRPLQRALEALRYCGPLSRLPFLLGLRGRVRRRNGPAARDCHWSPRISRRSVTVARREPAQSPSGRRPPFSSAPENSP